MRLWVNGELRQNGTTTDMIFGLHHLVWYISQFLVLRPGDTMRLEIDGLGAQQQTLGAA